MAIPKLFNNFMKVGFANYASRAIGAFITIILARWLGPTDFGIYSIGFYILTIFGMGFTGFDQSYVHFVIRDPKNEQEIFSTYCILKLSISLFIILLSTLLILLPFPWNLSGVGETIILCGLIGGLGLQLLTIILSAYQARKNFLLFSRTQLAYNALLIFLVVLGIQFNICKLSFYLLTYIAAGIIISIFRKFKISVSEFKFKIASRFWKVGKWLIMYHLLRMVNLRLDFFWLSKYYSGEVLGQYSAALKLVNIFAILIGTFPILLLPKASSMKNKEELKGYWRDNKKIIIFLLLSWVVIFAPSPFVIKVLYGPRYTQAVPILQILLFSVLPLIFALPLKYIFLAMEKTVYLFMITAIQTLLLFTSIPILVSKIGVLGSAYGKVISYTLTFFIYFFIYRYSKKHFLEHLSRAEAKKL